MKKVNQQSDIIDFESNTYRFYRECMDFAAGDDIVTANIKAGRGLPVDSGKGRNIEYQDPDYDPLPIDPVTALIIGIPPIYEDQLKGDRKIALRRANGYRWHVYEQKLYALMGVHNIEELRQTYGAYNGVALHKAVMRQVRKWNETASDMSHKAGCFLLGLVTPNDTNSNPMDVIPWFPWKNADALSLIETRQDTEEDFERRIKEAEQRIKVKYEKAHARVLRKESELDSKMARITELQDVYTSAMEERDRLRAEKARLGTFRNRTALSTIEAENVRLKRENEAIRKVLYSLGYSVKTDTNGVIEFRVNDYHITNPERPVAQGLQ